MRAKILCDKLYKPSRHLSTERETAQTWNPLEHISAIDVFNKLAKSSKFLSPPQNGLRITEFCPIGFRFR